MFNKLISSLPFNPSLMHQVSFYSKRLRKETSIRRVGFMFIALTLVLQVFAVVAPPKQSSANPANDLIPNGFTSKATAVNYCKSNIGGYGDILNYYSISCDNLNATTVTTIHSTDYNKQLYSMGRIAYGKAGEYAVPIGGSTFYMRFLWSWDTHGPSSYQALSGTNAFGKQFFVLYNCGNLVTVGVQPPQQQPPIIKPPIIKPPQPNPSGTIVKTVNGAKEATLKVGQTFAYKISIKNVGQVDMHAIGVRDFAPAGVEFVPNGGDVTKTQFSTVLGALAKGATANFNIGAKITAYVAGKNPNEACFITNGTGGCDTAYTIVTQEQKPPVLTCTPNFPTANPLCVVCKGSPTNSPADCLKLSKTAKNVTENIADANNTTAQPGDVIEYNLYVKNTSTATINKFIVQENLTDVLEYASVIDFHGGTVDASGLISWPAKDIAAGKIITQTVTVKIKSPIPENPPSIANPGSYDHTLTNVYGGSTINIKVPTPTPIAVTQTVATSLPNTGPGASLFVGFGLTMIVGYFFARTRLMQEEVEIVKREYKSVSGSL